MDPDFADGCAFERHYDVQARNRWDERHLARLAAAQDAIVRLEQLTALGLSREARYRRIAQRRLIALYRGVYAVGHDELSERGRFRAAVWAGGDSALLSDRGAARLLGLWERPVDRLAITVLVPRCPRLPGVTVHRRTAITARDRAHVRGIPCTSVARTLVDLAGTEAPAALEAAFERAERRGLIHPEVMDEMVRGRPGAAALRALLATHRPKSGATRSLLERRLLAGLRRAGLPEPIVNGHLDLHGELIEPDLMWPQQGILVELDGLDTHGTHSAMRRDRRRDRRSLLAGWLSLRFTWADVEHDLAAVLSDIRGAFGTR